MKINVIKSTFRPLSSIHKYMRIWLLFFRAKMEQWIEIFEIFIVHFKVEKKSCHRVVFLHIFGLFRRLAKINICDLNHTISGAWFRLLKKLLLLKFILVIQEQIKKNFWPKNSANFFFLVKVCFHII